MAEATAIYQTTSRRRYTVDLATLAGRFRHVRCGAGLSQKQCADKCGLHAAAVSHVETGERSPSIETMHKMLTAFPHLDLHWLITGQGAWVREDAHEGGKVREGAA